MMLRFGPWGVIRTIATALPFAANDLDGRAVLYKPYGTD